MPRKPRVSPIKVSQHVIVRGNNRQPCFICEEDMEFYMNYLKEYANKHNLKIHAWVLMPNHIHLLVTPMNTNSVSKTMQDVGRLYVRYFNKTYKRTGTLWEGRYKSSLVQSDFYLLAVYRYIELNPVRASMVKDPAGYRFSSYQINALGKHSNLCIPHSEYLLLGNNDDNRQQNYRSLFEQQLDSKLINDIRKITNKGMAIGNEKFITQIKKLTGHDLSNVSRGRPIGWRKKVVTLLL
ncbi:MAG: transposase [Methylococcales bacterium]|nr:transposase [Methylococcales bacterium]